MTNTAVAPASTSTVSLFDQGWEYSRTGSDSWTAVELPHDAMLHEERDATLEGGHNTGWYPGGRYTYRKTWAAPATPQRVGLLFEGVYRKSRVMVNGADVGGCLSGYTEFEVDLTEQVQWGAENLIEVTVDNSEQPNSRWYSGSGIYRHVWLVERSATGPWLARDGVRFVTRTLSPGSATADVEVLLDNADRTSATVVVHLFDGDIRVAGGEVTTDGESVRVPLEIADAKAWTAETPYLYELQVSVEASGDSYTQKVGLIQVAANARDGFTVNGVTTLLRGACVHHDNGVLGGATFRDAEFRRARILKEQGFNAIRSSHHPLSRDFLDACDEIGLYVMDETWDSWLDQKTRYDIADRFAEVWESDVDAMVAKDRNHPSVVMYSTGNEIGESATAAGIKVAEDVANRLRTLDPTRLVTSGVNPMLNVSALKGKNPAHEQNQKKQDPNKKLSKLQSEGFNLMMSRIGAGMIMMSALPAAGRAVAGVAATLDVTGYNYGTGRYTRDPKTNPERVIVGTETMTFHIAKNWALVEKHPHVIGDFMWTGWDYLGESGIGTWTYGDEPSVMQKPYPYLLAGPGAIDIAGNAGAPMLLARAVWGISKAPEIAVRPVDKAGQQVFKAAWRGTDAAPTWAWTGCEGNRAEVEVYSAADEVELLLNGHRIGRKKAGRKHGFVAKFRTTWQPGELTAVAYTNGRESGRQTLRSADGPLSLRVTTDRTGLDADGQSLAYLTIEVVDAAGTISATATADLTVSVSGPATLAGLGSATAAPTHPYVGSTTQTYRGAAQAVVRAGRKAGEVAVTVDAGNLGSATTTLHLR